MYMQKLNLNELIAIFQSQPTQQWQGNFKSWDKTLVMIMTKIDTLNSNPNSNPHMINDL